MEQEAEALNELAAAGWQGVEAGTGPVLDPDNEVARLAAAHPGMIDYGKASAALTPRQAPYRALPEVPMTDHQAGEILRLTGTDLRRPHHGAMAYAGTDEEKEAVGLSQGGYDEYITELSEAGVTSPYSQGDARSGTNGSSYSEVEAGYDSEVSTEVDRLLQVARDKGIVGSGTNMGLPATAATAPSGHLTRASGGSARHGAPWSSV